MNDFEVDDNPFELTMDYEKDRKKLKRVLEIITDPIQQFRAMQRFNMFHGIISEESYEAGEKAMHEATIKSLDKMIDFKHGRI